MNNYKILGLNNNASKEDIKKQYKKLIKEHHPDKGGDSEKFIEINEAYKSLMNENVKIENLFKMFMPKGPVVHTKLYLTLEEIEIGGPFEVSYIRKIPTGNFLQKQVETPFGTVITSLPEEIERTYSTVINVPSCYDDRNPLIFVGMAIGESVLPGDLSVKIITKENIYKRIPGTLNLKLKLEITLKEALLGFEREIILLNKEMVIIKCETVVNPYDSKIIKNYGMLREGDLIIDFYIIFPLLVNKEIIQQAL